MRRHVLFSQSFLSWSFSASCQCPINMPCKDSHALSSLSFSSSAIGLAKHRWMDQGLRTLIVFVVVFLCSKLVQRRSEPSKRAEAMLASNAKVAMRLTIVFALHLLVVGVVTLLRVLVFLLLVGLCVCLVMAVSLYKRGLTLLGLRYGMSGILVIWL